MVLINTTYKGTNSTSFMVYLGLWLYFRIIQYVQATPRARIIHDSLMEPQ